MYHLIGYCEEVFSPQLLVALAELEAVYSAVSNLPRATEVFLQTHRF